LLHRGDLRDLDCDSHSKQTEGIKDHTVVTVGARFRRDVDYLQVRAGFSDFKKEGIFKAKSGSGMGPFQTPVSASVYGRLKVSMAWRVSAQIVLRLGVYIATCQSELVASNRPFPVSCLRLRNPAEQNSILRTSGRDRSCPFIHVSRFTSIRFSDAGRHSRELLWLTQP
jgi:hypothetical protein